MFGKEKTPKTPPLQPIAASLINEKETLRDEKQNTVVASGTNFVGNITSNGQVGNITSNGQVHIYGTLTGNIEAKDNIIRIMRNGVVEGNLSCRELFIDGTVNGECSSETLNIEENGNINGTLTYSALTIKKGGTFSGQAKLTAPVAKLSVEKEKKRVGE